MTVARDRSQALFGIFFQGRRPACSSPSVIEEYINPQAYDCAEEGNCNKAAPGISLPRTGSLGLRFLAVGASAPLVRGDL